MSETSGVHVRTAMAEDERRLADLDADGWPLDVQVVPPSGADASFFTRYRTPEDVLVAEGADGLLGYAQLARHIPIQKNDHVLHLNALVVAPEARGRGISHLLIDAAVEEARRRGVRKLGLRALSTNTVAVDLYRKHGFAVEGRLREEFRQPDGSWADDLWLALFLDPERAPQSLTVEQRCRARGQRRPADRSQRGVTRRQTGIRSPSPRPRCSPPCR